MVEDEAALELRVAFIFKPRGNGVPHRVIGKIGGRSVLRELAAQRRSRVERLVLCTTFEQKPIILREPSLDDALGQRRQWRGVNASLSVNLLARLRAFVRRDPDGRV